MRSYQDPVRTIYILAAQLSRLKDVYDLRQNRVNDSTAKKKNLNAKKKVTNEFNLNFFFSKAVLFQS